VPSGQNADADRKWKLRASSYFQREVKRTFACINVTRAGTRCDLPCGLRQRRRTTADVDFETGDICRERDFDRRCRDNDCLPGFPDRSHNSPTVASSLRPSGRPVHTRCRQSLIKRIGERAGFAFPCGYALANAGHDTRALRGSATARSSTWCAIPSCCPTSNPLPR
jgi:hypothetical protein